MVSEASLGRKVRVTCLCLVDIQQTEACFIDSVRSSDGFDDFYFFDHAFVIACNSFDDKDDVLLTCAIIGQLSGESSIFVVWEHSLVGVIVSAEVQLGLS